MSGGNSQRKPTSHVSGLLLRLQRPSGEQDQFYLAAGMTIGRTEANTIVLGNEEATDRTHARLEISGEGIATLHCVEPDSALSVDEGDVHDLPLDIGVRFRIGRTAFECISGRTDSAPEVAKSATECPHCGTHVPELLAGAPQPCPRCGELIWA